MHRLFCSLSVFEVAGRVHKRNFPSVTSDILSHNPLRRKARMPELRRIYGPFVGLLSRLRQQSDSKDLLAESGAMKDFIA